MSQENVENARRGYAALNASYETQNFDGLRAYAEEHWDPDIVLTAAGGGVLAGGAEWRGPEGVVRMASEQMEAFRELRIEPKEIIDHGDVLIVPVRLKGTARHTGIEVEFDAVHVLTTQDGKGIRFDFYDSLDDALEAAGLEE